MKRTPLLRPNSSSSARHHSAILRFGLRYAPCAPRPKPRLADASTPIWSCWAALLVAGLTLLSALPASAQKGKKNRVVTISEVTIVGRVQKPIAAVDVSRIQPKLTLAQLRKPFMDRIEKALHKDPF